MRHQIRPVAPITVAVRRRRWRKRSVSVLGVAITLVAGMLLSPTSSFAATGYNETTGSLAHTWTNYTNAGGTEGPSISANQTVQVACVVQGFRVKNGNTNWYRIASSPWNNAYYVSADPFYNNGATSGELHGTPFVDQAVPSCAGAPSGPSGGTQPTPNVALAEGPVAPAGYRYAISLTGFNPNVSVAITCYDSVSTRGFYTFSLKTNASGAAFTASYCYSGDGPDHWVIAGGATSNHVSWSAGSASGGGGTVGGGTAGPVNGGPNTKFGYFALGDSYSSGEANPPFIDATCDRSHGAWPYILGTSDSKLTWIGSVACSGATTSAITTSYKSQVSQASVLKKYASQVRVITVTIGGNDVKFADVLGRCFVDDCHLDGMVRASRTITTNVLPARLATAYHAIRVAAPGARVVVVGYPRLFPTSQSATANCGWLTPTERNDLNSEAVLLDTTIKEAAHKAGFDYVSTLDALKGHELCTKDSWVYKIGPTGGSFRGHPLPKGQAALRSVVQAYLSAHRIG